MANQHQPSLSAHQFKLWREEILVCKLYPMLKEASFVAGVYKVHDEIDEV